MGNDRLESGGRFRELGPGSEMSSLDPSTMALVAGLVSVLQTLAFFVLWRFNRQMPGVGSWG